MATADEAALARTPLGADLKAGIDAISYNQEVTFTQYVQKVLPADGYVFWVRGDLLDPFELVTKVVMGSFHYSTQQNQEEAESYSVNRVLFTAEAPIDFFNDANPQTLWIASYRGLDFAFSSRGNFYVQAAVWHYSGNAIYADMRSQIITTSDELAALGPLITSNSLPVWLGLNAFVPDWPFHPAFPLPFQLYPSFLVPQNISPPWGAVHIGEDDTNPIPSAPYFNAQLSQEQLSQDRVQITLWGCDNATAMNFVATVNQFSYDTGLIGVVSRSVPRDAKRTQNELGIIAQKKVIEYEVTYLQQNVVDFARQVIERAPLVFIPNPQ